MKHLFLITSTSLLTFAAVSIAAEPLPTAGSSTVKRASFDRSVSREDLDRVKFAKQAARVGDEVEQTLALEMRLATMLRQGNQIGEKSRTVARNEQRRVVTTTHVEADRALAVRVRYVAAAKLLSASEGAQGSAETSTTVQPVAGKTYLCQREPGKDGKLAITDEVGTIPPTDEYEILAQHMEMVGRPNPLAEFLAGKSIAVGETLELPREVAGKIFNLGNQLGDVTRFTLTLDKLEAHQQSTQATFIARVEATSNNASQMRLEMHGLLVVETDTCRALKVDLSGPIAMSETRGSYSTSYQVIGTGQLKMSVVSSYRDAKR
jgi:hypothetical protein